MAMVLRLLSITSVVIAVTAFTTGWPITRLERSIGRLQVSDGQCTAFSIHAKEARWITATHCFSAGPAGAIVNDLARVEGLIESTHGDHGLTVFQTDRRFETAGQYPALPLGPQPAKGEEILILGFGGGSPQLVFFAGLQVMQYVEVSGSPVQVYSAPGLKGMSGGPIVDRKGRVVGVMVGGFQPTPPVPTTVSFSADYTTLARLMRLYGER